MHKKYPDLKNFETEVSCLEKASQYSLENVLVDVKELEKGMEITRRELDNRLSTPNAKDKTKMAQNQTLKEFVDNAGEILTGLRQETNRSQTLFKECVEYFGESPKMTDANAFFGHFVRFIAVWKQSETENEKRRKLLLQKQLAERNRQQQPAQDNLVNEENQRRNRKNLQSALISELKSTRVGPQASQKSHRKAEEVKDGTLEDIIMGLKSEPYRANVNEAMRRSFRRQKSERERLTTALTAQSDVL